MRPHLFVIRSIFSSSRVVLRAISGSGSTAACTHVKRHAVSRRDHDPPSEGRGQTRAVPLTDTARTATPQGNGNVGDPFDSAVTEAYYHDVDILPPIRDCHVTTLSVPISPPTTPLDVDFTKSHRSRILLHLSLQHILIHSLSSLISLVASLPGPCAAT